MGKLDSMISFFPPEVTAKLRNTSKVNRNWSASIKGWDINIRWAPTIVEKEWDFSRWSQPPFLTQAENLISRYIVTEDSETTRRAMEEVVSVWI